MGSIIHERQRLVESMGALIVLGPLPFFTPFGILLSGRSGYFVYLKQLRYPDSEASLRAGPFFYIGINDAPIWLEREEGKTWRE